MPGENSSGLSPIILLTHSSGNNLGNLNFAWKVEPDVLIRHCFRSSQKVIELIKLQLHQSIEMALFTKVTSGVKPAVLCSFYKELMGDFSALHDTNEAKVDACERDS